MCGFVFLFPFSLILLFSFSLFLSFSAVLCRTPHEDWDVGREMRGWGMEGRPVLLPFVDDGGTEDSDERRLLDPLRAATPFHSKAMHRVSISSSCSSPKRGRSVNCEEKQCDTKLKKSMTERHARWSKNDWYSKSKHQWRSSAVFYAGQSSNDKWKSSKPQSKWKEISLEMDALGQS